MTATLRPPQTVMRLNRLGSAFQTRLSFMRILTRRMQSEGWSFTRPAFEIDENGVGHAVYAATGPHRTYSLVAFAHDLPDEQRSDRVIAEAWDATFALFDGVPTAADIERLSNNVPLQEAGRISTRELSLSRANRSVRAWNMVVDALAGGDQPDPEALGDIGYLMRTTAVYGSGKFGAAEYACIADRPEMQAPFQAEMLSVFLTRAFVRDLANHMARAKGGAGAAMLDPDQARELGIGNSTGLGLAPFLINHPRLLNNWIAARETAIARVRGVERASADEIVEFGRLFDMAVHGLDRWRSRHPIQVTRLKALREDAERLKTHLAEFDFSAEYPWNRLYSWAEGALGTEGQEFLAALLLEPYGALVDDLANAQSDPTGFAHVDGAMTLADFRALAKRNYDWALAIDWTAKPAQARVWYTSEEKLEPRLGERYEEPVAAFEQPLAPGRDVAALYRAIEGRDGTVADLLVDCPEYRHTVRRVQVVADAPFGEIHDNTIDAQMLPIDMLRLKLAYFGAQKFDPRSDRWVRINMYAGAPYPEELAERDADFWPYAEAGS